MSCPRPRGELLWLHAPNPDRLDALLRLAQRAAAARRGLNVLLTTPGDAPPAAPLPGNVIWRRAPGENPADTEEFIRYWAPDLCLWSHGNLRHALLASADAARVPMVLVDADARAFSDGGRPWLPDLSRATLGRFRSILALSGTAARRLRWLGARDPEPLVTGPLQEAGPALACNAGDLDALTALLIGRPVWLAAMARPEEFGTILGAQRQASRLSHRLLLILVPDDPAHADAAGRRLADAGLRCCRWSEGRLPDEATQVLLADTRGEMGLWYRLAPVSFMASSLLPGAEGCDPFEPATLGSAILYGPETGRHAAIYARMAAAGAARPVRDAASLAAAIMRLVAPDQAATMANAAWQLASDGAEATDRVLDLVQDILDGAEPA